MPAVTSFLVMVPVMSATAECASNKPASGLPLETVAAAAAACVAASERRWRRSYVDEARYAPASCAPAVVVKSTRGFTTAKDCVSAVSAAAPTSERRSRASRVAAKR
jgi:hypothetical protein